MKISKKILATIILPLLASFAWAGNTLKQDSRYIIFGDSLSDTGSAVSSEILNQNVENQPSFVEIDINGNKLVRDMGNNYWALADYAFVDDKLKPFQGGPITSFGVEEENDSYTITPSKTWANYLSDDEGKDLVTYRAAISDPEGFGKYLNDDSYNILFATATAQSGNNFIDDLDHNANSSGTPFPYTNCSDDQYGTVIKGSSRISCVPSVNKQVKKFIELAKNNGYKPNENTKVVIWVGGNDVFGNIQKTLGVTNLNLSKITEQFKKYHASLLAKNVNSSIKELKSFGVKSSNIYVFAIPNFKYVPAVHELLEGMGTLNTQLTNFSTTILFHKILNRA